MVHSDLIFWQKSSCKRRRFLSISENQVSGSQSCQKHVLAILADSGGPSLLLLTERWPAPLATSTLPESGNIEIRLLASGRPSKRSVGARKACTTRGSPVYMTCSGSYSAREAPPIKVAGGQESTFVRIQGMRILYWF